MDFNINNMVGKTQTRPEIKADFFYSGEMPIPQQEEKTSEKQIQVEDWKTVVNRGFMKGLTGDEIRQLFRNRSTEVSEEMNRYINKYEGLIGPVFVDSHVLQQGFPVFEIPKKFKPYQRFAINCDDIVLKTNRHVEGGLNGELESFLDNVSGLVEKTVEVCRITGLPILKKGMFNDEVIDQLLNQLGVVGHGQKALQDALKEKVLGIRHKEDVPNVESNRGEQAVLKYNLKEGDVKAAMDVMIAPPAPATQDITEFDLKEEEAPIEIQQAPTPGIGVEFKAPSTKTDIVFTPPPERMENVQLDGVLRWPGGQISKLAEEENKK